MGIQSKKIRGRRAVPPAEGVGGEALHETDGLGGWCPLIIKKYLNPSKSQTNTLRMLSIKSTIYQNLKITQKTHELKNPFQNIAQSKINFPMFAILSF